MRSLDREIVLDIAGLGIIFYSPESAAHILLGANYLRSHYMTGQQVQEHVQVGSLVGFATSSPGTFVIRLFTGYPDENEIHASSYKLRLGLHCRGGTVCFRDLYDLMHWDPECPADQTIELPAGFYHVTLCSNMPASGVLGDNQVIKFYLQQLPSFPSLGNLGVPTLC